MRQRAVILWKEWREVQWFFWVALFTFICLPCIGALQAIAFHAMHDFRPVASPWVYGLGGVLAVFVAAGASCRDFQSHLEDFWRSRPFNVRQWLNIKYGVGLGVVIIPCILPLVMERSFDRAQETLASILWLPFFWAAIYSLTFFFGVLLRRAAHAAMLGLAAMFLLYTIPTLVPALQWLDVQSAVAVRYPGPAGLWPILFDDNQLVFGASMLLVSFCAHRLAVLAVARHWHVESGPRLLYGAIGVSILIACASANLRLATNLPVLAKANYGTGWCRLQMDGGSPRLITWDWKPGEPYDEGHDVRYDIKITSTGISLENPTRVEPDIYGEYGAADTVQYRAVEGRDENGSPTTCDLVMEDRNGFSNRIRLWGGNDSVSVASVAPPITSWTIGRLLYVLGDKTTVLDISNPRSPKLISVNPKFPLHFEAPIPFWADTARFTLPNLAGVSKSDRLQLALLTRSWGYGPRGPGVYPKQVGDILYRPAGHDINAFELTKLSATNATFEKIATYHPSLIETLFNSEPVNSFELRQMKNLCYVPMHPNESYFYGQINVFDARDGKAVKLIGHFAAPNVQEFCPLPDGRILAGGNGTLWLVGAPGEQQ